MREKPIDYHYFCTPLSWLTSGRVEISVYTACARTQAEQPSLYVGDGEDWGAPYEGGFRVCG